jgi:hypothetical protein
MREPSEHDCVLNYCRQCEREKQELLDKLTARDAEIERLRRDNEELQLINRTLLTCSTTPTFVR